MFSLLLSDDGKNLLKSIIRETVQELLEEKTKNESLLENTSTWVETNSKDQFLTRKEVSQLLKVTLTTLNNWQKSNTLIPQKIGKRVLYNLEDVKKAMLEQKSNSKI